MLYSLGSKNIIIIIIIYLFNSLEIRSRNAQVVIRIKVKLSYIDYWVIQRQLRVLDYRIQHSLYTCSGGSMCKPLRLYSRMLLLMLLLTLRHRDIYAWSPETVNNSIKLRNLLIIKESLFLIRGNIGAQVVVRYQGETQLYWQLSDAETT